MPTNLVKTKTDEKAWARAKAKVESEYPHVKAGSDQYYKLTVSIYKSMR